MSKKKYAKDTSCEFKGLQFQGIFRRGFPRFFSVLLHFVLVFHWSPQNTSKKVVLKVGSK